MNKSEYQNPKSETMSKIRIFKCSKPRQTWSKPSQPWKIFLSFVFWSFRFVSNFDIRISNFQSQRGQALITLLFFVIIAVTITSAATIVIGVNSLSLTKLQEGSIAYYAAESGIENAILRAIRDPSYTGETLTLDNINVTITVSGVDPDPRTITVVNANGNFRRTIQAQVDYDSGYYTISGWKEI